MMSAIHSLSQMLFYLNYEGCKPLFIRSINPNAYRFYLNYEGCKQIHSFISYWILHRFYLNYEGCKLINLNISCSTGVCFI